MKNQHLNQSNHTDSHFLVLCGLFAILCILFVPLRVHGADSYVPLVGIPHLTNEPGRTLPEYINALYLLTIGLGSLLAFFKITWAGVKYMLSDIVTDKSDAKDSIKGALLGLAILLIPFIVLSTIYPNLTNLDVLKVAPAVTPAREPIVTASSTPNPVTNPADPIIVTSTFQKNTLDMVEQTAAWARLCDSITPPAQLKIIDSGDQIIFQCLKK
jgi:hypothetical protein